jgi:hypothetical protein
MASKISLSWIPLNVASWRWKEPLYTPGFSGDLGRRVSMRGSCLLNRRNLVFIKV